MSRHVKGRIPQPDQNEPFTVNAETGQLSYYPYETSAFPTSPDTYVAIGVVPDFQQIGGYRLARGNRLAVNNPGLLRNDFVGQLLSQWNAPSTIWWGRSQGTAWVNTGGSVYQPLPSYDSQIVNQTPPPANRAAFTSAVKQFLATRGARANG